jgi:guanylate kinase
VGRATDSPEKIEQRVGKAAEEIGYAPQFDKTVVNDDLEKAVAEVEQIVKEFIA